MDIIQLENHFDININWSSNRKLRIERTPPISPFWGFFLSVSSESEGSILLLTELAKMGLHFLALWPYFLAWYPTLRNSDPLENGALLILPLSGWSWILTGQLHWWVDMMFIVSFTHCHSKYAWKVEIKILLAAKKINKK